MENIIEWEKRKIDLNAFKQDVIVFVDLYNNLNIMNKQTFNLIKIRRHELDNNEAFAVENSEGMIISRFMDFDFFIRQL